MVGGCGSWVTKRDVGLDGILRSDELSWKSKSATEDDGFESVVVAGGCIKGGVGVIVVSGVDVGGGLPLMFAPLPILSCQACDDLNCSSRALIPAGS